MSHGLAAQDREILIRLASSLPTGSKERHGVLSLLREVTAKKASVMPQDLPDFKNLEKGLRGIKKRYRSLKEANASLDDLLRKYGLRVFARKSGIPGHRKEDDDEEAQRLFLQTDYGANIYDPLLVIHGPSWGFHSNMVHFQVSF